MPGFINYLWFRCPARFPLTVWLSTCALAIVFTAVFACNAAAVQILITEDGGKNWVTVESTQYSESQLRALETQIGALQLDAIGKHALATLQNAIDKQSWRIEPLESPAHPEQPSIPRLAEPGVSAPQSPAAPKVEHGTVAPTSPASQSSPPPTKLSNASAAARVWDLPWNLQGRNIDGFAVERGSDSPQLIVSQEHRIVAINLVTDEPTTLFAGQPGLYGPDGIGPIAAIGHFGDPKFPNLAFGYGRTLKLLKQATPDGNQVEDVQTIPPERRTISAIAFDGSHGAYIGNSTLDSGGPSDFNAVGHVPSLHGGATSTIVAGQGNLDPSPELQPALSVRLSSIISIVRGENGILYIATPDNILELVPAGATSLNPQVRVVTTPSNDKRRFTGLTIAPNGDLVSVEAARTVLPMKQRIKVLRGRPDKVGETTVAELDVEYLFEDEATPIESAPDGTFFIGNIIRGPREYGVILSDTSDIPRANSLEGSAARDILTHVLARRSVPRMTPQFDTALRSRDWPTVEELSTRSLTCAYQAEIFFASMRVFREQFNLPPMSPVAPTDQLQKKSDIKGQSL